MAFKIVTIVGARPQFVKAGAFSRSLQDFPEIEETIVHTGQHFDAKMSDVFFEDLRIPKPKYNLDINGANHGEMTGKMLEGIEKIILNEKPHAVLVYGDTNSTLAGALAAAKLHISVVHQEAGLRSYNKKMPEEINRVLTDHVSSLLLCPTHTAIENLKRENISKNVHHVGDVMYDATKFAINIAPDKSSIISELNLNSPFALVTIHRAENTDDPQMLSRVFNYLLAESKVKNIEIVMPLHPRTKKKVLESGINIRGLNVIEPVGYIDMHCLLMNAECVYTDSGGLQKEAYFHQKSCVTLRSETEWVETLEAGWNRLWETPEAIAPKKPIKDYGDGNAGKVSAQKILEYLRQQHEV